MKTHLPAALLFALAGVLYLVGEFGGGVLAGGLAFVLEAKAWSQVLRRSAQPPAASARPDA